MPLIRKERAASDGTVGPSGDRASQSSVHWAAIKAAKRAAREAGAPAEPATPTTTKDSGAGFGADMSAEESAATFAPPPPQQAPAAAAPATAAVAALVPRSGPAPPHGAACDAPGCPGTRPVRAAIPLCRACTLLFVRHLNQDPKYRQVRDALLGEWISARQLAEAEEAMVAIGAEPEEAEGAEGDAASAN